MSELPEDRMRQLLRSADGPRHLTSTERERLLARLDAVATRTGSNDDLIAVTPSTDAPRRGRNAARHWMAAAATVVAIVAGIMFAARDRFVAPAVDQHDSIAVPPAPPATWCSERVDPLVDALERWRGVENWAWAGGVPDIGSLAVDALSDFPAGVDARLDRRATQISSELASELAAIDPARGERVAAAGREAAVEPALAVIAQLAADRATGCASASIATLRDHESSDR